MNSNISFPESSEYAKFYSPYIDLTKDIPFFKLLQDQKEIWRKSIAKLDNASGLYKYAPTKWTIKEVLQHIIDVERIFVYRALSVSRKEKQDLIGFDENEYVANSNANLLDTKNLVEDYLALRSSTELFFRHIDQRTLNYMGRANGQSVSVRAIGYMLLGHEKHHLKILNERYNLSI